MIKIKDFYEKEFRITWTLLNIGFDGSTIFKKQLTEQDIIDYAISKIEDGDESLDIVLLASSSASNPEEIKELLKKLSNNEKVDTNIEFRKWRVMYVAKHLPDIQNDYIQGLLDLGDIWAMFNFPDDSPHIFQGRNNSITPEEYYTQENYEKLLEIHQRWIKEEISYLRSLS